MCAAQESNLSLCVGERRCTSAAFRPSELTALKSCPIFTDGATQINNLISFSLWKLLCKQTADGAGLEPAYRLFSHDYSPVPASAGGTCRVPSSRWKPRYLHRRRGKCLIPKTRGYGDKNVCNRNNLTLNDHSAETTGSTLQPTATAISATSLIISGACGRLSPLSVSMWPGLPVRPPGFD